MVNPRLRWLENRRGSLLVKLRGQQWALQQAKYDYELAQRLAQQYTEDLQELDEEIAALQGHEHG